MRGGPDVDAGDAALNDLARVSAVQLFDGALAEQV
jgi:hypothetical protein